MPERQLVPQPDGALAVAGLPAFPDWHLPFGWMVERIDLSRGYPAWNDVPWREEMEVGLRHFSGHEARIRFSHSSTHPREWLNPILEMVAKSPYRLYLDINATEPTGYYGST